jgi:hypothetical protein
MKPRNHVALAPQSGAGRHSTPKDYQRNPKHRLTQEAFQMKLKNTLIDEFENAFDDFDSDCDPIKYRVIEVTESYRLHITVSPTIPEGHYHLKIESQWLGAKDPNGLQTRYQVTLSRQNLLNLTETILEATR